MASELRDRSRKNHDRTESSGNVDKDENDERLGGWDERSWGRRDAGGQLHALKRGDSFSGGLEVSRTMPSAIIKASAAHAACSRKAQSIEPRRRRRTDQGA